MDPEALVAEQVAAGAEFVNRFNDTVPLKAAFWLKPAETGRWHLYLASERMNDAELRPWYGEVLRLAQDMQNPNLDPFQVKLIGTNDPVARAVMDVYRRYPGKMPIRYNGSFLGDMSIEGAYIYPLPITVPGD
jgi:hypothetical protein